MKRSKKLISLVVAAIFGLSLILVPPVSQVSPVQAAITWTKYPVTLENEAYVIDAWVIKEGATSYKMWYTHAKSTLSITEIIDAVKTLNLDNIVTDISNLDLAQFLNHLDDLNASDILDLLAGISTVIGYATSSNGRTWTVVDSEVLSGSGGALGSVGAPCVIWDATDSKYKMWYTRVKTDLTQGSLQGILDDIGNPDNPVDPATRKAAILSLLDSTRTVIEYTTSSDGVDWGVPQEALAGGSNNLFDSVGAPGVFKFDGNYIMCYTRAKTDLTRDDLDGILTNINDFGIADFLDILYGTRTIIEVVASGDGINWGPPDVALAGSGGAWDSVADPCVVTSSSGIELWFTNVKTNLLAASLHALASEIRGLNIAALWTTLKNDGIAEFINDLMVALDSSNIRSLLSSTSTVIGYATLGEGGALTIQNWQQLAGSSGSPWSSVAAPCVVKTGNTYEIWYTEGIDELTWQNLLGLVSGANLPIGYASYTPYVAPPPSAPPPEEEEVTAEDVEEMTTEEAAETVEEMTTEEAADIIEVVTTDKAANVIEVVTTDKAVAITEKLTTDKAVAITEKLTTDKAAAITEKLTTNKAAAIVEKVTVGKATAIMEKLTTEKLTDTIPAMSETSLTERLPGLSTDKLYSVKPAVLFASLPNAPTEQLVSEEPPQPPAGAAAPVAVYTTPSGARYLAIQTWAGEWVVVMGTPMPVDKLLIKTKRALTDIETTLEIFEEQPPEIAVGLSAGQIARAYLDFSFENVTPEDIELGHMTFKVEKEWLEQNSIHKWSVVLSRYDSELGQWISLPTKRVKEDDLYVYYSVVVTHFSKYAILGSQVVPALEFRAANLLISPVDVEVGEEVIIRADVSNLSGTAGTFVVTLWIDGTVEAGQDVFLEANETKTVSFTVACDVEGSYEVRLDRLLGSFNVTEGAPEPAAFTTSALTISPTEVDIGQKVTISAVVANTGDLTGTYKVTLKIDNVVIDTKDVTLAGGTSQTVTFTTAEDVAAAYQVEIDGQRGEFTVVEEAVPPTPFPWWWIIVGVVVIGLLVYFLVIRRRA